MIRHKIKTFLYVGVVLSTCAFFVIFYFSAEEEAHSRVKRRIDVEMPPADDENFFPPHAEEFPPPDEGFPPHDDKRPPGVNNGPFTIEGLEYKPGVLICQPPPVNPKVTVNPLPEKTPPPIGGGSVDGVTPKVDGVSTDDKDPKDAVDTEKDIATPSTVVDGGKVVVVMPGGVETGEETMVVEGGMGTDGMGEGGVGAGSVGVGKEEGKVETGGGDGDGEKDKEVVDAGGGIDSGSVDTTPYSEKKIISTPSPDGGKTEVSPEEEKGEGPIVLPPVKRPIEKEPIVSGWTNEEKFIGCCPSGDRNGVPFKEGMACCVDHVYNATDKFCCLSKKRPYEITRQNLMFCYPPDRIPFCRLSDLGLEELRPLDVVCKTKGGKNKNPSECTFICPPGSQVRGDKRATCSEVGTWNDANPQCCEGCPPQFKQDIWFIVDIDQEIGIGNLSSVRSFVKQMTSYFPIGQDKVRVAVTPYNSRVFDSQGGWYLNRYNTPESLNKAINNLPREGSGRHTGGVLAWLAENAFEGKLGDRPDVPNLIVLITTGPPDDNHLQDALEVIHDISRFIVITVGPKAHTKQFQDAVSPPRSENYLHAPTFHSLDQDGAYLYSLLCQEHCLEPQILPK